MTTGRHPRSGVINLRFNQDFSCFASCMETGLRIYNVEPLVEKAHYDLELMGSIGQCEMLYRTNFLAVVCSAPRPKFPDNILLIYDDALKKFILNLTFSASILAVRLCKDRLVVATISQINVYSFFPNPVQRLFTIDTRNNPRGLCELSTPSGTDEKPVMVFPGHKLGSAQLVDMIHTEEYSSSAPIRIMAHNHELGCVAINRQGDKIATASTNGTIIRVWDTNSHVKLMELRRGADPATIFCLNFSGNSDFLCCSSDKGTVHIFAIKNTNLNKNMILSKLYKYSNTQRALTNFTVPQEYACVCAFGKANNSVIALCVDGTFHKYVFNASGACNRESFDIYLDVCEDDVF